MSIDIGGRKGTGVIVEETIVGKVLHKEDFVVKLDGADGLVYWHAKFKELMVKYKPHLVVSAYPTRNYWAIFRHGEKVGLMTVLCWELNAMLVMESDSHYKKELLGNGRADKEAIAKHYKGRDDLNTENLRDAQMFLDVYKKTTRTQLKKKSLT